MSDFRTTFPRIDSIGETLFTSQLENGLKMYLDWGFLKIGGWGSVNRPSLGGFGGDFADLRPVSDPNYTDGQVWESARKEWVWETGVNYTDNSIEYNPIAISGVYINNTLYGTGDATYGHTYNYPLGRVIFNNPISTSLDVEMNYSYRNVQTYVANEAPWWDEIQHNSYRVDDTTFDKIGSGNWSILSNQRVQLPAVVIETLPKRAFKPYEMGSTSQFLYQDLAFHILSEDKWWKNQIIDIISEHKDHQIHLLDNNVMAQSGAYPLDHNGMLVNSDYSYNNLVGEDNYRSYRCMFKDITLNSMNTFNPKMHQASVKATFEIIKTT